MSLRATMKPGTVDKSLAVPRCSRSYHCLKATIIRLLCSDSDVGKPRRPQMQSKLEFEFFKTKKTSPGRNSLYKFPSPLNIS